MKFFNRKKEIEKLKRIDDISHDVSQFTVLTGRRRIGKTELVKKAYEGRTMLYFFVARKAEADLCEIFMNEIREKVDVPIPAGRPKSFVDVLKFIMELACERHIILFIDEFQDFYRINPSIYSEMQNIWDTYKSRAKINLIVAGSINSLMNRIFKDEKEPLFGRHTSLIHLQPFRPDVLKEVLATYHPQFTDGDLLALYALTGGVAKYIELLVDNKCLAQDEMLDMVLSPDSYFINEGKNLLIEEFGKDYSTYFSILTQISTGRNTRSEIENALATRELSGYLRNLCDEYCLINKRQPLFETSANKNVKYVINDQFLRFWFRFIYKYSHVIEAGGFKSLRQIVERDFATFTGPSLESYFVEKLKQEEIYSRIGYWHDRKCENEIDIIAENMIEKRLRMIEVKRNERCIDLSVLRAKTEAFLTATKRYADYDISYEGLSLEDM